MSSRNRLSSHRKNKDSRFNFEKLEDRNLLSGTTGLIQADLSGHEASLLTYLSENQDTQHLQNGINGLQMLEAKTVDAKTTTVFRQTIHGMPVHGSFVTVVQDGANVEQVYDKSFSGQLTEGTQLPGVGVQVAQALANQSVSTNGVWNSSAEMVWFVRGDQAELAWEVSTSIQGANVNGADLEFVSVVDASEIALLSQVQSSSLAGDLLDDQHEANGIFPRIVINDTIGAQGSRDYAADPKWASVVQVANGCTGALAAPNMIISARHCGVSAGAVIDFGIDSNNPDSVFTVQSSILPDGPGTLLDGGDVAILILTENVPTSVAEPYTFTDQTDALEGQLAFTLGYGLNGIGSEGHQGSSDGIRWGGENIIDVYGVPANAGGANIISTDFDDGSAGANTIAGSDPMPLEFEATTAPGDSGGAIFVQVGADLRIAGVLSGGTSPTSTYGDVSWWTGTAIYQTIIEDNGGIFGSASSGEVEVEVNGQSIATLTEFAFGTRSLGDSSTEVFTVTNTAVEPLTLANDLSVLGNGYTLVSGFAGSVLAQGESTTFTVRFDANALGTFNGIVRFGNSDGDENPFVIRLTGSVAGQIGEAGLLEVTNSWQTVALQTTYKDPVVVAGPVSSNEADPAVVRIRNITPDSFQIRVQEWRYLDGPHAAERISFAVLERGVHRLQTGQTIVAGSVDGINTQFSTELFSLAFDETPVVVASSNTYNGGAPITTRLHNVTKTGFQVAVQEEEAADNKHNGETIGYFAFIQEEGSTLAGSKAHSEKTGRTVDERGEVLFLDAGFTDPPVFLATMQTTVGTNAANLRLTELDNSRATVFVEEEQSRDQETGHGDEAVGFLALEEGLLLGSTAVGESMRLTVGREWQTVNTAANYLDPVVIASTNTTNESDPLTIRVRNVTANSFQIHIEEWNYQDLDHTPETVSVMVFESGIHRMRDGTIIEARNSEADLNWTNIDLTRDYEGTTPAVFSQVVSENGPATATIRTRNVTENAFEIRVQEEEASEDGHVAETVAWVAVKAGAGFSGGQQYDILRPTDGANHKGQTYTFDAAFNQVPVTISAMQTTFGTNTATIRQSSVNTTDVNLFVEEEQSFDRETGHGREQVAVFATAPGVIDGVLLDFFSDDDGGIVIPAAGNSRSVFPTSNNNGDVQQMLRTVYSPNVGTSQGSVADANRLDSIASSGLTALSGATSLQNDLSTGSEVRSTNADNTGDTLNINELDEAFESLI